MTTSTDFLPLRPFGRTDLRVTPLCVGCAQLGDMPETFAFSVPEERALETIRAAFRGPINYLDTAASYGDGESERRIGLVLKELGGVPAGCALGTKCDRDLHTGDFSGGQIQRSIERSLRLLGLDRIDVMFLHDPEHTTFDNVMSRGGPLEVMQRFKAAGVIGCLGVAGGPIDMSIRYVETGAFEAVITHNRYTLLNRLAEPLLNIASVRGLAVMNAAPYGSGMLAKGPEAYARYAYQAAPAELLEATRAMADICARYDVPLAAAALQFSLRDPRLTSTIVGMSRPERIEQTLALARHPIPDELWPELLAVPIPREDPESHRWQTTHKM